MARGCEGGEVSSGKVGASCFEEGEMRAEAKRRVSILTRREMAVNFQSRFAARSTRHCSSQCSFNALCSRARQRHSVQLVETLLLQSTASLSQRTRQSGAAACRNLCRVESATDLPLCNSGRVCLRAGSALYERDCRRQEQRAGRESG